MKRYKHLKFRFVAMALFFLAYTNLTAQFPWRTQHSPINSNLITVSFPDSVNGYIASENGEILQTDNGGLTWHKISEIENIIPSRIDFTDAQHGWLAGNYPGVVDSAAIYQTLDSGKTWNPVFQRMHTEINDLIFLNDTLGWVAGCELSESDTLSLTMFTTTGGFSWTIPFGPRVMNRLYSIHFRDMMYGRACGQDGLFLSTFNGGMDTSVGWSLNVAIPTFGKDLYRIYNSGSLYGCAVGEGGFVLATKDKWGSWQDYTLPSSDTLNAVTGYTGTPQFWAIGNNGCLVSIRYALYMWMISEQTRLSEEDLHDITQVDDLYVWAVGDNGTILYYNNNYAPIAADDEATVRQDESIQIFVLENDIDFENQDLDIFSYKSGKHGLVLHTEGSDYLEFHPDDNYAGIDTLSYVVTDHHGGYDTAFVFVNITEVSMGPFEKIDINFDSVAFGNAIWGDIDRDNDYDVIVCGEKADGSKITALYWNENGNFVKSDQELEGIRPGNDHAMAFCDIDMNGLLDFFICGENNEGQAVSKLYLYNPSIGYFESNTGIPGVLNGSADWGDYDNDGDLDLLISGNTGTEKICRIYRNDEEAHNLNNWTFTPANSNFHGLDRSAARFVDFNYDNYLDVISAGRDSNGEKKSYYYTNSQGMYIGGELEGFSLGSIDFCDYHADGIQKILFTGQRSDNKPHTRLVGFQGTFKDIPADLENLSNGSADWGDYDNDGDYDLIICGINDQLAVTTRLYTNNSGALVNSGIFLPGMASGTVQWGDYDADGDLDILMSGYFNSAPNRITSIFKNNTQSGNEPPGLPSQLLVDSTDTFLKISWQPATDDKTPGNGLSYNYRIKRKQRSGYKITPISNNEHFSAIAGYGNANDTAILLKGLEAGALYTIELQTIDAAYKVSPRVSFDFNVPSDYFVEQDLSFPYVEGLSGGWFEYNGELGNELLLSSWSRHFSHLYSFHDADIDTLETNFGIGLKGNQVEFIDFNNDNLLDFSEMYPEDSSVIVYSSAFDSLRILTGIIDGCYDWADYDEDGDVDLIISGRTDINNFITKLYVTVNGIPDYYSTLIPGVIWGDIEWVDFDGDGDQDIAITGYNNTLGNLTRIYENRKGGFIERQMDLPGLIYSSFDFSDYDNDGDMDMLICGQLDGVGAVSRIYRNNNGMFTASSHNLVPILQGKCRWIDVSNDGKDDIILSGNTRDLLSWDFNTIIHVQTDGKFKEVARIKGDSYPKIFPGDFNGDLKIDLLILGPSKPTLYKNEFFTFNGNPYAPKEMSVIAYGDSVKLFWTEGKDSYFTSDGRIMYNLRVGTSTGSGDILSPLSYENGLRKVVKAGNIPFGRSKVLRGLSKDSVYYAAVQSVDPSLLGSEFSNEMVFNTVSGSLIPEIPIRSKTASSKAEWVDVDSDQDLDLLVAFNEVNKTTLGLYRNNEGAMDTSLFQVPSFSFTDELLLNDYDNDNDVDLLLRPYSNAEGSQMLRNDNGIFTAQDMNIDGLLYSISAWGDLNNDGRNDIITMGAEPDTYADTTLIYLNRGDEFEPYDQPFRPTTYGEIHWVDIDNDGDKDLVRVGYTKSFQATADDIACIINRNVNGAFVEAESHLPGLVSSSMDFGDYDNDGDLDMIYTGGSMDTKLPHSYICENTGGNFEIVDSITPIFGGCARWYDHNNDGLLDIIISGYNDFIYKYNYPEVQLFSGIFLNTNGSFVKSAELERFHDPVIAIADYDFDKRLDVFLGGYKEGSDVAGIFYKNYTADINISPPAPLIEDPEIFNDSVILQWFKPYDADIHSVNLYFNLRIGTSPGGSDVLSPLSHANGIRKILNTGNMQQATSFTIKGLDPSTDYYYSVQAIDKSFGESPWSDEISFTTLNIAVEKNLSPGLNVKVYPVPAHDQLTLEVFSAQDEPMNLEIFDESGRCVQSIEIPAAGNHTRTNIQLPGMGFYMMRLTQGVDIVMKKIVVTR